MRDTWVGDKNNQTGDGDSCEKGPPGYAETAAANAILDPAPKVGSDGGCMVPKPVAK
jgi:hypothetical protein